MSLSISFFARIFYQIELKQLLTIQILIYIRNYHELTFTLAQIKAGDDKYIQAKIVHIWHRWYFEVHTVVETIPTCWCLGHMANSKSNNEKFYVWCDIKQYTVASVCYQSHCQSSQNQIACNIEDVLNLNWFADTKIR